uniref:Uncharacterized protein n=1 Tax=Arundo donax TaxID=35708 RepID=A0A0A9A6I3_ARUDO
MLNCTLTKNHSPSLIQTWSNT